eukprot:6266552-Pyramimonas_sp.AAC.1
MTAAWVRRRLAGFAFACRVSFAIGRGPPSTIFISSRSVALPPEMLLAPAVVALQGLSIRCLRVLPLPLALAHVVFP